MLVVLVKAKIGTVAAVIELPDTGGVRGIALLRGEIEKAGQASSSFLSR